MLLFRALGPSADRHHRMRRSQRAVAQDRLKDGERGERRRVGTQNTRSQPDRRNKGQSAQPVKLAHMKTALRPAEYGPCVRGAHIECESLQRIGDRQRGTRVLRAITQSPT